MYSKWRKLTLLAKAIKMKLTELCDPTPCHAGQNAIVPAARRPGLTSATTSQASLFASGATNGRSIRREG